MKRNYDQGKIENDIQFFIGEEVEHTPAFGKKTLFVVGVHSTKEIQQYLDNNDLGIEHIYFGANMSFPRLRVNDGAEWAKWETMIFYFLDKGYLCTLDLDIECVEGLVESGLCESNYFIPMISAKLPYIQLLNYNAILKLDDKDFNASNPGVWCHSIHDLKNRENFTDWSKYTKDTILK
jgi:hypothetical protein